MTLLECLDFLRRELQDCGRIGRYANHTPIAMCKRVRIELHCLACTYHFTSMSWQLHTGVSRVHPVTLAFEELYAQRLLELGYPT
jgi:hypothetical protein